MKPGEELNVKRFLTFSGLAAVALTLLLARDASPATVTAGTLEAWNEHVAQSKAELKQEVCNPDHFLWIDRQAAGIERVRAGEVLAQHAQRGAFVPVPSGIIHHWIGTVFIQNARAADTLAALQDYDSYSQIYDPAVIDSKLLSRGPGEFTYRLKFVQKGFGVKTGLLAQFRSRYVQLDSSSGYSVTEATQLSELENAGTPDERSLPFNEAHGYVEKAFTIVRYRESEGGVYVEVETLTLSRDIPSAVRWMVSPLVQKFSRQVMTATLDSLRNRVADKRTVESASAK
jgi:hypothetical protein